MMNIKSKMLINSINYIIRIAIITCLIFHCNVTAYCDFPEHWAGTWFQKGNADHIRISGPNMTEKGVCTKAYADKYLLENRQERCYRCLVITEKHRNVLQYKETPTCVPKKRREQSLNDICSNINGDAPLYSLFRLNVAPVKCPFHGPYKFSYSRGHGECKDPPSSIESCTDDTSVLFKFQACTDVQGTESRVERLECFAEWKDGHFWYLVGKIYHSSAITDEDRFRCFCFEKTGDNFNFSQSGDATCDGLTVPTEGSKTMRAWKTISPEPQCVFPSYMVAHRFWRSFDGTNLYDFYGNSTFQVFNTSGPPDLTIKGIVRTGGCIRYENKSNAFNQLIIHSTSGCNKGYVCMKIHKRADNVVELEIGDFNNHASDACNAMRENDYITLTTTSPTSKDCPIDGVFNVKINDVKTKLETANKAQSSLLFCTEQSSLTARCERSDQMILKTDCDDSLRSKKLINCLDSWSENSSNYLIVSHESLHYCLRYSYSESDNSAMNVILSNANCVHTHPSSERNLQANNRYASHSHPSRFPIARTSSLQTRAINFLFTRKEMCLQNNFSGRTNGVDHIIIGHHTKINVFVQSFICWLFLTFIWGL